MRKPLELLSISLFCAASNALADGVLVKGSEDLVPVGFFNGKTGVAAKGTDFFVVRGRTVAPLAALKTEANHFYWPLAELHSQEILFEDVLASQTSLLTLTGRKRTEIGRLTANSTAFAASASGRVAGGRLTEGDRSKPFTYLGGKYFDLPIPSGASICEATAISADGKVVAGYATFGTKKPSVKPVVWRSGEIRLITVPSAMGVAKPHRLSPSGEYVAGLLEGSGPALGHTQRRDSFVVHRGRAAVVPRSIRGLRGTPIQITVLGINSSGVAVGEVLVYSGANRPLYRRAFIWDGKLARALDDSVYLLTSAVGITDAGQVLCSAEKNGKKFLFMVST